MKSLTTKGKLYSKDFYQHDRSFMKPKDFANQIMKNVDGL